MRLLIVLTLLAATAHAAPNVVLIIGDDQAWTDYGFMGHPHIQTPHLDALAADSLQFRRGYVVSSLCRPSLASIATGLFPHEHGITGNDPQAKDKPAQLYENELWIERFQLSPQIAGLLGGAGYVSHQSGKWWEGHCRCGEFTEGMTHGDPARGGRHGDDGLAIGRETMAPIFDFIDGAVDKPFFIWYAPFLPHRPHNPPQRLLDKYAAPDRPEEIAAYYAMCEWLDETVGQLVGHLEARNLRDNTIVVFLADNGWVQPLRTDDSFRTPFGAPRGKRSPYDGGLRTPILVNYPAHITPQIVDTPVSSIDIAPTIAAAVGIPRAEQWPGVNLLDLDAVRVRPAIFGAIFSHDAVDIMLPAKSLQYRWIVSGNWKLIEPYPANLPGAQRELYDLSTDPTEQRNAIAIVPGKAGELRDTLNIWWNPNNP
jgi:uncharacterized sulfatase